MAQFIWPAQSITATNPSVGVNGAAIPLDSTLVGGSDGTNIQPIKVASDGTQAVSISAGSAVIGHVIVDSGTLTAVTAITNALPAGANLIGKVGIDQTTPGTTNGVQVNAALPAGSNVIGHVIVDASSAVIGHVIVDSGVITTVGAVTAITNALPTGANVIGALTANQSVNVSQINGVTPLMGAGNTGTGSARVTIASDQAAIPVSQSGTWTVQPGNTANTTAWLVNQQGKATANSSAYNDYTGTSVTTSAYVQLIASTTSATTEIEIFDSSGQGMILATGAAASEVDQIYIFPGGNGRVPLKIAASTRVSIKAKTATASVGYIMINFYA